MTEVAIHSESAQRMGFFTDTTVCIGCKACEVACKQWNDLPADGGVLSKGRSYDATASLGASTWRHVRFVELAEPTEALKAEAREALARGRGGQLPGDLPAVTAEELAGAGGGATEAEMPDLVSWADERGERSRPSPRSRAPASRTRPPRAPRPARWAAPRRSTSPPRSPPSTRGCS